MPGLNGIEATRRIREIVPDIRILMVTMLEDDTVFAAMRAGARGYILKGGEPAEVLRAIRAVADGEAIFSPGIAERLTYYFAAAPAPGSATPPLFPELTDREREVLAPIAQGLTNSAIAEQLVLSPKTVRTYVTEILGKLQVADRAQAIIRARNAGLAWRSAGRSGGALFDTGGYVDALQLTQAPTMRTGMLIRRPAAEVFAALVDPGITTKFWFTRGSGRLDQGHSVEWFWDMYNVSAVVTPQVIEPERRIVVEWPGYSGPTTVEWRFTPGPDGATFVEVRESGFAGDGDSLVQQVADSTQGFALMLAGMKAWLEHGIQLNLVADRYPAGLTEH